MNFHEIAQNRQSCRSYDAAREIEEEKLAAILEATQLSPSACNGQPYHLTVCKGEAAKAVAAATMGMGMNKFAAQGLSSCILGWFDDDKIRKLCDLTDPVRLVITLGYPKEGDPLRTKKRKELQELVSYK